MTMPGIKAKRKQLVRKTLRRAKAQGERTAEQRQESPEEYAQTEVQQGNSDVAARTGNTAKSTARMSYRKFRAMQEKRKNLTLQGSTQSAFSAFPFVMRSALNAKKSLWLQRQFGNMCCSPTKCCTLQTSGIILYRLSSRSRKKEPALGL